MNAEPWLTLVGIGEDGTAGLCPGARNALAQASLIVGGRRHLALVGQAAAETLAWASPMEGTYPAVVARRGTPVVVLASGDPYCYGVGAVLARHVPPDEMRCFPQLSAFALATARLGWAQQDCSLLSLCGRPLETLVPTLRPGARILALSADAETPGQVARLLVTRGFGASTLTVLEAMGGPRERIRSAAADAFAFDGIDPLNTMAIDVAGQGMALSLVPGRPDAMFENDGQITKADVRAATLARLAPRPGEILWDVGAGSGSVAIEWMLADPGNRAFAIERHPERVARLRRNAAALGVPGLAVSEGAAPEALAMLPAPDAVFVGGGATRAGVLDVCETALRPGGRLVVNAVTIETQGLLIERFRSAGGTLTTLSVALADLVGGFHGWRPAMPVMQWTWVKA